MEGGGLWDTLVGKTSNTHTIISWLIYTMIDNRLHIWGDTRSQQEVPNLTNIGDLPGFFRYLRCSEEAMDLLCSDDVASACI